MTKELAARTLLIVDDQPAIRSQFKQILSMEFPYLRIDAAPDGAAAVETFSTGRHDILILDLHMPVMDGLAAYYEIEMLCESRGWDVPATIFCTGYVPPDKVRDLVDKYPTHRLLLKPVATATLLQTVRDCGTARSPTPTKD